MKNPQRIIVAAIIIITTTAGFGAWHFWNSRNKTVSISIGAIPYEKNALIYIAQDQKYFAANGLDVTLRDYVTGVAAVEAMKAGKVDIAAASEFVVVGKSLKNDKLRIFASIAKTQDDYVFGRTDRGINNVSDLKGKRIGLKKQTAAEFYLGRFLDRQGMNIRQVKLVDINPSKSVETFSAGDLDAIVIWQPYAYRIKTQPPNKVVSWPVQNGQLMYWNLVTTDAWISGHQDQTDKLLKSLAQAELFLMQHPAEAKAIVQRRLGYDAACISAIWPDTQFTLSLDQSLIVAMEDEARWMIANNLTSEKKLPDYLDYIHQNSLSAVKPEVVNIIR